MVGSQASVVKGNIKGKDPKIQDGKVIRFWESVTKLLVPTETKQGLGGLLGTQVFLCPHFLF